MTTSEKFISYLTNFGSSMVRVDWLVQQLKTIEAAEENSTNDNSEKEVRLQGCLEERKSLV